MNMVKSSLGTAFCVALLLGGSTEIAETAILAAVESSEDVSQTDLVIETVKFLVRRRKHLKRRPGRWVVLPFELGRLFLLETTLRDSFVLRILLGLPPKTCAEILGISIPALEDALFAALQELPYLEKRAYPSALAADPLRPGGNL